jgi:segregation and condensation protein A
VRRLLEYEQMKLAAQRLSDMPQYGRDFLKAQVYVEQALVPRFPDVRCGRSAERLARHPSPRKAGQHHRISREELSVREHMSIVLRKLQGRASSSSASCSTPNVAQPVLVVTFIAMLELAKETLIELTQAEAFAPIYVRLAYTPS